MVYGYILLNARKGCMHFLNLKDQMGWEEIAILIRGPSPHGPYAFPYVVSFTLILLVTTEVAMTPVQTWTWAFYFKDGRAKVGAQSLCTCHCATSFGLGVELRSHGSHGFASGTLRVSSMVISQHSGARPPTFKYLPPCRALCLSSSICEMERMVVAVGINSRNHLVNSVQVFTK